MNKIIFRFDNCNVGSIDKYISEKITENEKYDIVKLNIQNEIILNVYKCKNLFPLILNEVKTFFEIPKIYYNIVLIDSQKYLAYENLNNVSLLEYSETIDIKNESLLFQLQRIFAFNFLMCINSNYENKIKVFPNNTNPFIVDMKNTKSVIFKSINEKSFKYDILYHEIPKSILERWFEGSLENFRKVVKDMVNEIDPDSFRQETLKIVRKYDESYVPWVNSIYLNIRNAKGY
jgi:hypothetical protein